MRGRNTIRSDTTEGCCFTSLFMQPQPLLSIPFPRAEPSFFPRALGLQTLDFGLRPCRPVPDACHCFLFAAETVSNTIPCEAHMARGIAMTTDICRRSGEGAGFRAHAATPANAVEKDLLACGGELQASFEG